jgi:hypothetical protein
MYNALIPCVGFKSMTPMFEELKMVDILDCEGYKISRVILFILFHLFDCRKSPQLKQCITNFTAVVEPCLDDQEKENKHLIQNITDSVLKFVCYKEGDRIACK